MIRETKVVVGMVLEEKVLLFLSRERMKGQKFPMTSKEKACDCGKTRRFSSSNVKSHLVKLTTTIAHRATRRAAKTNAVALM
jgi:hypothetical protein